MSKVRSRSVQFSVAASTKNHLPSLQTRSRRSDKDATSSWCLRVRASVAVPSPVPSPHRPSPLAEKKIGDAGAKAIAEALRADTIVQRLNLSGACGSLATVRFFLTC